MQPRKLSQLVNGAQLTDVYLPAITEKTSNPQAATVNLSHSCPYVYGSRRRRSTSSVISQRASDFSAKTVKKQHAAFSLRVDTDTQILTKSVLRYRSGSVYFWPNNHSCTTFTMTGFFFSRFANNFPLVTGFFIQKFWVFIQSL